MNQCESGEFVDGGEGELSSSVDSFLTYPVFLALCLSVVATNVAMRDKSRSLLVRTPAIIDNTPGCNTILMVEALTI